MKKMWRFRWTAPFRRPAPHRVADGAGPQHAGPHGFEHDRGHPERGGGGYAVLTGPGTSTRAASAFGGA